eukprot:CAMPEP_0117558636 /NCGR_PEP_ID=MMETSP0784-20121206/52944_1 /TAXON_ID=39447 /ORGANISM="" /LENGTH=632 /DNA_ID=CAMNT_0005355983 /DNA_START=33 /DNA_END=1931 /DNA_ORIENTATION=+
MAMEMEGFGWSVEPLSREARPCADQVEKSTGVAQGDQARSCNRDQVEKSTSHHSFDAAQSTPTRACRFNLVEHGPSNRSLNPAMLAPPRREGSRQSDTMVPVPSTSQMLDGWLENSTAVLFARYYFWTYVTYLASVMVLTALVLSMIGDMSPFEALYLAVSSGSMTGLSSVSFAKVGFVSQFVVWLCIIMCSPMLLTLVPVLMRRYFFHRQVEEEAANDTDIYRGLTRGTLAISEADALTRIGVVVICYWLGCQLLGWIVLWFSIMFAHEEMEPSWIAALWHALFLSTSAFHNAGLVTLKSGIPSDGSVVWPCLTVIIFLILAGNTCFPIFLRVTLVVSRQVNRMHGEVEAEHVISYLLRNPRRCYTHLFPGYATRWISVATFILIISQIFAIWVTETRDRLFENDNSGYVPLQMIFLAVSTRTAGFSLHSLAPLCAAPAFVMCVCMWISTSPVTVAIRSTEVDGSSRARAYTLDGAHLVSGLGEADVRPVRKQLRMFMTDNSGMLLVCFFVILVCEEHATKNFVRIMFEFCSSWGTVGLSMADTEWSFSGEWKIPSQLSLMTVMFLGRLRGLPNSLDPSVSFVAKTKERSVSRRQRPTQSFVSSEASIASNSFTPQDSETGAPSQDPETVA